MIGDVDPLSPQPRSVEREMRWVQSCISAVGFPNSLEQVRNMGVKNQYFRSWATDLDLLLEFDPNAGCLWSVSTWISAGDILFLYHTKRSKRQIAHLRRQLGPPSSWRESITRFLPFFKDKEQQLACLLEHAAGLADRYSGKIFACGLVGGPARHLPNEGKLHHYHGTIFADLAEVYVFSHPLDHDGFSDLVKIKRQSTITPLARQEFDGIKRRLAAKNEIPLFLRDANLGDRGFRNINRTNWHMISCAPDARFIHETQLRAYLLDFLLHDLGDVGTSLLEECECFRNNESTGFADYFVRIYGTWLPVEAKLNVLAEKDLSAQLRKYTDVDEFKPTKGNRKGARFATRRLPICLVADQVGVYLTVDGEFVDCGPGAPLWKRTELGPATPPAIRKYLHSYTNNG